MLSVREENRSPLVRLVMFMVCLSVFGSVLAGAGFAVFELPGRASADHAPSNYGQICTVYQDPFWAKWNAFWRAGQGCVYEEHDYGDFIIYDVCCPK